MPKRKAEQDRGFTLLEVLLAMTLTASVLVIIFAGLRMGLRSVQKSDERIEKSLRPRLLMDRLAALIRSAYPYMGTIEGKRRELFFQGESDLIGFVTAELDTYSASANRMAGFRWVKLKLEGRSLVLLEGLFYDPAVLENDPEEGLVVDADVEDFRIEYYRRDEEEETGDWVDSWDVEDSEGRLPGGVRITLKLREGDSWFTLGPLVVRIPLGGPGPKS